MSEVETQETGGGFTPYAWEHRPPPGYDIDRLRAQRDAEREAEEAKEAAAAPKTKTLEDEMLGWLDEADEEPADVAAEEAGSEGDDPVGSAGEPLPAIQTEEDQAEAAAAILRLRDFDPAEAAELEAFVAEAPQHKDGQDIDPKVAMAELRLAEMRERGEFAALYSRQIQEEIEAGDEELRLLDDDLTRSMPKRERKELEEKYVALTRRIPTLRKELDRRTVDAGREDFIRNAALEDAKQAIMDKRKAKLREAKGQLLPEDHLAGKERPRKQSPATIDKLEWELAQPIDQKELAEMSETLYKQKRAQSRQGAAMKFYKVKDDTQQYRRTFEVYYPGGLNGGVPHVEATISG